MKKCSFCAEEISDEATSCKHCGNDLQKSSGEKSKSSPVTTKQKVKLGPLETLGLILLVIIAMPFWFLTIPAIIIWCVWEKTKLSNKYKLIITATLLIFVIAVINYFLQTKFKT